MGPVGTIVRDTWNALLPISCVVCGGADDVLCHRCFTGLIQPPVPVSLAVRRHLFDAPVVASGVYQGGLRQSVLAFKDHGYHRLAKPLARLLENTYRKVSGRRAVLVPIPSSLSGWIRRGVEPTLLLATELVQLCPELSVLRALRRPVLGTRLPRTRKAMPRAERLQQSPALTINEEVEGLSVWLLDDVATTGVTLERAASLLRQHGATVSGAMVLAASHQLGPTLSTAKQSM